MHQWCFGDIVDSGCISLTPRCIFSEQVGSGGQQLPQDWGTHRGAVEE